MEQNNKDPIASQVETTPQNNPTPQMPTVPSATETTSNQANLSYASVPRRFIASFVDGVIVVVLIMIISIPLAILLGRSSAYNTLTQLLNMIVGSLYYVILIARSGQTIGKKLFKIKVVSLSTNTPPSYGKAFLREVVGKLISSVIVGLGYFWTIWDKKKQTWHDKIAGTVVIKTN